MCLSGLLYPSALSFWHFESGTGRCCRVAWWFRDSGFRLIDSFLPPGGGEERWSQPRLLAPRSTRPCSHFSHPSSLSSAIIYHCDLTREPLEPHVFREVTVKGFNPGDYQTTQVGLTWAPVGSATAPFSL